MDLECLIAQTAAKIHNRHCTRDVLHNGNERGDSSAYWDAVTDNGLHLAWARENAGGFGASLAEVAGAIWNMTPSPLPLVETLIANKLLEQAGLDLAENAASFAIGSVNDAQLVPMGAAVHDVILFDDSASTIAHYHAQDAVTSDTAHLSPDNDMMMDFSSSTPIQSAKTNVTLEMVQSIILSLRSVQMASAMDGALTCSINYVSTREQFGRPLSKFQAIQHQLAVAASEVAAAAMSASQSISALDNMLDDPHNAWMQAAISKVQIGHSVEIATSAFQQVHGAMGYTMEYDLHHYTRRLWAWRDSLGNEHHWAQKLGELFAHKNSDQLWQGVTAGRW